LGEKETKRKKNNKRKVQSRKKGEEDEVMAKKEVIHIFPTVSGALIASCVYTFE
jgi:hypothetical protein